MVSLHTKKWAYYNDADPFACAWARELIKAGLVADGEVDERPIQEVQPSDLAGFVQCHFFCGILGWSLALRLAGWPDDRAIWTGSAPCQPFSSAGAQAGGHDPRDLWPAWFKLIAECRPSVLAGEQVSAAVRHGWLDRVCADLEACDYAVGAVIAGAHSVGAFHIRQRLWFVADDDERGREVEPPARRLHGDGSQRDDVDGCGEPGGMVDAERERRRGGESWGGDAGHARLPGEAHFWSDAIWLPCADGKARPVEPGTFPLAHGVSARVGRLRGYGNAIVPQVAAAFIQAYLDA